MGIHIRSDRCFECGEKITFYSYSCNSCSEDVCVKCTNRHVCADDKEEEKEEKEEE